MATTYQVSPSAYIQSLQSGAPRISAQGLVGRIIRGKRPEDFATLTDDPKRQLVLLMGPDGLERLAGKNGYDMLVEIGYDRDYIKRKILDGNQFKLIVYRSGKNADLANWDNVIRIVSDAYPQVAGKLRRNAAELRTTTFDQIERLAGFDFSDVDAIGESDSRYMTAERFERSAGTLADTRAFLYFTVHLRELFSGDGYTYTNDGVRCLSEYLAINQRIDQLGEHELLSLSIDLLFQGATNVNSKSLPLPSFYDPANAEKWAYRPNHEQLFKSAQDWRAKHKIQPSASDKFNLHVLYIDVQKDFCFPEGSLYVGGRSGRGAVDDSKAIAEFTYRNLDRITNITTTMDTHFAYQIFFPSFWVDAAGNALTAHTVITTADIRTGKVRPNPQVAWFTCNGNYPWLLKQVEFYCSELEAMGKYTLYLWPPHCILESDGHALVGVIHEARMFHSYVRSAQSWVEVKGGNFLTENYSVMRPEVLLRHDGLPLAQKNANFINTLLRADAVVIAGQAASHCVASSIEDLLTEIKTQDPKLAQKVYILSDCMSAVAVPDGKGGFVFDFTPQATAALQKFQAAGMNVVKSTDPIETWPGIRL
jgi:nicotinamidase-related amidase